MTPAEAPQTQAPEELPGVVTRLFKGVVYAETDEKIWQSLLGLSSHVRDYVAVLGLDLILDESEGYAFLKSREDPDGALPRLIPRRPLTFNVSLLLALLRGRMLEFDTNSSELRLIMTEPRKFCPPPWPPRSRWWPYSCPNPAMRRGFWTSSAQTSRKWWNWASYGNCAARQGLTRWPGF